MNVASLELCKELYKLSGWNDLEDAWHKGSPINGGDYVSAYHGEDYEKKLFLAPAYDLGYLLRNLTAVKVSSKTFDETWAYITVKWKPGRGWHVGYKTRSTASEQIPRRMPPASSLLSCSRPDCSPGKYDTVAL